MSDPVVKSSHVGSAKPQQSTNSGDNQESPGKYQIVFSSTMQPQQTYMGPLQTQKFVKNNSNAQ